MKPNIEELRKKYIDNPPEGMTSKDIRHMSEDELPDMDYFLNDDELDSPLCPPPCGPFSMQESAVGGPVYLLSHGSCSVPSQLCCE